MIDKEVQVKVKSIDNKEIPTTLIYNENGTLVGAIQNENSLFENNIRFQEPFINSPYLLSHRVHFDGEKYDFRTNTDDILSVVRFKGSYGHEYNCHEYKSNKYEMARIKANGKVCEPLGYLTVDDVMEIVGYENGSNNNSDLIEYWLQEVID